MDIGGQHDTHDPHGVKAEARQILAQHRQSSITGLCMRCGRCWAEDPPVGCDAPEVMNARQVLNNGRPEFRLPGANRLAVIYSP